MSIEERFKRISAEIPSSVRLVAVSKKQPSSVIGEAYGLGLCDFAENYQQEAAEKQESLGHLDINWHFIGSIQSKKLKKIVGKFDLIHSVDRIKILKEIDSLCSDQGIRQKVLVQVNFAGEATKSGLAMTEMNTFFTEASRCKNVDICGLMVMPPFVDNPEDNRPFFKKGRETLEDLRHGNPDLDRALFRELSMGTSQDYQVAIQEGATMVRIGTQLLGERTY